MAAASSKKTSGGDMTAPAPATATTAFSYAQAAKGLASTAASTSSSRVPSGTMTPSKGSIATPPLLPQSSATNGWADDVENVKHKDRNASTATSNDVHAITNGKQLHSQRSTSQSNGTTSPPSPDFGNSSTSTFPREDDLSSLPNASSESTWENKSQTSNVAEKPVDSGDKLSKDEKKRAVESQNGWTKPVQEAPVPAVNIWAKRMEEAKVKAVIKPTTSSPPTEVQAKELPSTNSLDKKSTSNSKPVEKTDVVEGSSKDPKADGGSPPRSSKTDEKPRTNRREQRNDEDAPPPPPKSRKSGSKGSSKDDRTPPQAPPPSMKDETSWPTPEIALVEERKKPLDKAEKVDKDKNLTVGKGKAGWVSMPITPSVVFSTPIPNTHSRRGGRSGGRGGRDSNARGGSSANGSADKAGASHSGDGSGESSRREKGEGAIRSTTRSASPGKGRRATSEEHPRRDGRSSSQRGGSSKESAENTESRSGKTGSRDDSGINASGSHHNNTLPRHNPPRSKQNRRNEGPHLVNGDARKDNESSGGLGEGGLANGKPSDPTNVQGVVESNGSSEKSRKAQSEEVDKNAATVDGTASKYATHDRRSGSFQSVGSRAETRRGSVRGGRNSLQGAAHPLNNGQVPMHPNLGGFNLQRSPTLPNDAFFGAGSQAQRGFRGPPTRAQSIATEGTFGRFANGYPPSLQTLSPLNTIVANAGPIFDYGPLQTMSAIPYTPLADPYSIVGMLGIQLEYYFSVDNLCKDMYLRQNMDSQGFVLLTMLSEFNRIKQLTQDLELLKFVCQQSHNLELRSCVDGQPRVRKREGWEKWVLEMSKRNAGAQHDGVEEVRHMGPPEPMSLRQTSGSFPLSPSSTVVAPIQPVNGFVPMSVDGIPNEQAQMMDYTGFRMVPPTGIPEPFSASPDGFHAMSANPASFSPNSAVEEEADSFSNAQAEILNLMVRRQEMMSPNGQHATIQHSFSNGSLERSLDEVEGSGPNGHASSRETETQMRSPSPMDACLPDSRHRGRRNLSTSGLSDDPPNPVNVFWVKDKESPANEIPPNTTSELYVDLRSKALEQRQLAATGTCPYDMDVLYQFWSHFLIRNFNTRMFDEFRQLAEEDSTQRLSHVGKQNLIKYYAAAVAHQAPVRDVVARHYIDRVRSEGGEAKEEQDRPAFKQLRNAWRNGALNLKTRKKIRDLVDSKLLNELDA